MSGGRSGRPNNPTNSIIMANIKSIHCLLVDKPVVIEAESGYLPEASRVNVIKEEAVAHTASYMAFILK